MAVYSEDLRVKVVEFLEKGYTQQEAAEVFGVSAKSVWIWNKMHKEGKRLVFEFVPRSPHRVDYEQLAAYVKEHPDAYLREIGAHFSLATSTVWNALKRLGFKYKKKEKFTAKRIPKGGKNSLNS